MKKFHIVLTGGPCSGKTKSLDILKTNLEKDGFKVVICNETGTDFFLSGLTVEDLPWEVAQSIIVERALVKEITIRKALQYIDEPVVVIYDRAVFDNKAYLENQTMFDELLDRYSLNEDEIMNGYSAIFHLITTAKGLESNYGNASNQVRFEDAQNAVIYDDKVRKVWSKHEKFKVIDNYPSFEEKFDKLYYEIKKILS